MKDYISYIAEKLIVVTENCDTPEKAREAVVEWGKKVKPSDAALGLVLIDMINSKWNSKNTCSD